MDYNKLREAIAEAEHNQWMKWAKSIFEKEPISEERKARWKDYFKPYADLTQAAKDLDLKQADIILEVLVKHDIIQRPTDTNNRVSER